MPLTALPAHPTASDACPPRLAPWLLAAGLLAAHLPAAAATLVPGENSVSYRVEAFSAARPFGQPELQSFQSSQDLQESETLLSMAGAAAAQVGPAPGSNATAAGWAVAGAAGTTAWTYAGAGPNGSEWQLNNGHARAEALASWWDSVVVTAPGVANGSAGRLTAHVLVTGSVSAPPGAYLTRTYAAFSLAGIGMATVPGASTANGCGGGGQSFAYCTVASTGGYNNLPDGVRSWGSTTVPVTVDFVFGTPFELGFTLISQAYVQSISWPDNQSVVEAQAVSAFGSTVRWGGIDTIRAGSQTVGDYGIASASGTDFRVAVTTAVPEPATWALLALGIAVLLGRRRLG